MTAATGLLRSAASAMRERAEAATRGPWSASDSWAGANAVTDSEGHPVAICGEDWPENGYEEPGADRRHIASWHPAVALKVADLLDRWADEIESTGAIAAIDDAVVKVAAAYLGRTE